MVSQLSTVTGDGKPSENANMDCVAASVDAYCRFLLGQPENSIFNADHFKDEAYGDAYRGGTSASAYAAFCKSLGINLHPFDTSGSAQAIAQAHTFIQQGKPVIFTMLDPYVDTNLPQYEGWTHVCVWYSEDAQGLTAMDPYIARPVYKTNASWASLLRSNQLWIAEKIVQPASGVPEGWHDAQEVLTAPNGLRVIKGFRAHVLANHWDPTDEPEEEEHGMQQLEGSNQTLGSGTQQAFRKKVLEWTPKMGVIEMYTGRELLYTRQQVAKYYTLAKQLHDTATALQAELQALQQGLPK